jgi:hypothetical protein
MSILPTNPRRTRKKCEHCLTDFEALRRSARFCSDSCRTLASQKRTLNRQVAQPDDRIIYQAALAEVNKAEIAWLDAKQVLENARQTLERIRETLDTE